MSRFQTWHQDSLVLEQNFVRHQDSLVLEQNLVRHQDSLVLEQKLVRHQDFQVSATVSRFSGLRFNVNQLLILRTIDSGV